MDTQTLIEQEAEAWVRAVKKAEEKIKAEEKEKIKAEEEMKFGKLSKGLVNNPFNEPNNISNELASFLGISFGSKLSRTKVVSVINTYIRVNNLTDETNKRKINADDKLINLFKLNEGDELTYFNMSRYLAPHISHPKIIIGHKQKK